MNKLTSLCWLRHDLRLRDHPALTAAVKAGPAAAIYILNDDNPRAPGGASRWWLHQSLTKLAADLAAHNIPLILRRGDPLQIIPALLKETGATALHATRAYDPWLKATDQALAEKIDYTVHPGALLHDPDRVKTKTGGFYKVYGPFSRTIMGADIPRPLPAPKQKAMPRLALHLDKLEAWRLLPTQPDWAGGMRAFWTAGEAEALKKLKNFTSRTINDYAGGPIMGRDRPAQDFTSRLSPHLAWGEISPRQIWHAIHHNADATGTGIDHNRETFLKELIWRDFAHHTLYHQPELPDQPLDKRYTKFPWLRSTANLKAWQRGQTGYPIVDAGMRQLWQLGWMHNRLRLITASFLIKHLMIKWQEGEQWFWDTLVDADIADNTFNWQWVAGSGNDASPFFRIFNPVTQGRKFDSAGAYVRQFVPELAKLPDKFIHAPWLAPAEILAKAGVKLGKTYPQPIVDHEAARARAMTGFQKIRQRSTR